MVFFATRFLKQLEQNDKGPKQITSRYLSKQSSVLFNANIFMFFNPIEGKRRVDITDNRTAKDWAHQIKQLVDVDYPEAKKLRSLWLILIHTLGHLCTRHSTPKKQDEFWIHSIPIIRRNMGVG